MAGRGGPKFGTNKHRNVTLRWIQKNGIDTCLLLGPDGEIEAFNFFVNALKKFKHNTRKNYCHHVADAYDYILEASFFLAARDGGEGIEIDHLREAIDSWHEYLTKGRGTSSEVAFAVNKTLPSPLVSEKTSSIKHAALRKFLALSEAVRSQQATFVKLGLLDFPVDINILYPDINKTVKIDRFQRREMIRTSMFAGVVAGGPKVVNATVMPISVAPGAFKAEKAFPFDKVALLIGNFRTRRDKALYSLYAASGCRQHEGLQLLWRDIDPVKREVKLMNPNDRSNYQHVYRALTPSERDKLAWKARLTSDTYLIEPFASMFWTYLEEYVRHEYYPHNEHEFVFQHLKKGLIGRPYYLSTPSTRSDAFYKAAHGLDLSPDVNGGHSLRHMYGVYILNYFPKANGEYGLPIEDVRLWMGHASIKSTEQYAIKDKNLAMASLRYGNINVFQNGAPKTLTQLKIEALTAQIRALERDAFPAIEIKRD